MTPDWFQIIDQSLVVVFETSFLSLPEASNGRLYGKPLIIKDIQNERRVKISQTTVENRYHERPWGGAQTL